MSNLILALMAGLPGTGKTTLARILGPELGWFVIDKDGFKQEFLGEEEVEDHEKASRRAYKKSFYVAREKLTEEQTSVILDSAVIDRLTLDNAKDIIKTFGNIELKVILCVTSRDERNRRAESKYSKTKVNPVTWEEYLEIFKHLPKDKLILDTEEPLERCLEKAKEYLIGSPVALPALR